MFKTYKDKLVEIEGHYNDKDYNATIVESAKLTEKALYAFFNQFHSFLATKEDWNKYLVFEQENGERYSSFLKKPTIGVAIGYYTQLLDLFPNQFGLTHEIKKYLNQINQIRNSNVHASGGHATDEEAASILDSLEKILTSTNLSKTSVDIVGVPIKFYLVYKSIREKFEVSQSEEDFSKIVSDSKKILPELLSNFINKIYPDLPLKTKVELTELYNLTVEKKKENTLAYYIKLCLSLDISNRIKQGESLKDCLEFINLDSNEASLNRRQTRHYVTALEIIIEHTDNPETRYFLDFADAVKKKYLVRHTLTDRDRIILEEKAQELSISKDLAIRIEESVIKTIEKELILFQTLTVEDPTVLKISKEEKEKTKALQYKWYWVAGAAIVVIASIFGTWYFTKSGLGYTDYEVAFFAFDTKKVIELTKNNRPLDDVKANYYYIQSLFANTNKIPEETKIEYQKLLKANPNSPSANLYLGMIYNSDPKWREEIDSSWVLINKSENLGMKGLELKFVKEYFFARAGLPEFQILMAQELEGAEHPRAKSVAGGIFLEMRHDTTKAIRLFKEAIKIYPNYISPYLRLSSLFIEKRQYDSARRVLTKATQVNSKDAEVISALAKVYKEEGRFDLAKDLFRKSISDFAQKDLNLHGEFAALLFLEDSISQGIRFVDSALVKFPKDRNLLGIRFAFVARENSLKSSSKKQAAHVTWLENLEEAKKTAKTEGTPILLNIYSPLSRWSQNLDKNVFTDSVVANELSVFVRIKINGFAQTTIAKQYHVQVYPTILLLDADGKRISEIGKYHNKEEFIESLHRALKTFNLLQEAKDPSKRFTEVSNFEDAKIIARSKRMPIMILVGDDRSEYTKKIRSESFQHPLFKPASQNMVYLYLNKDSQDPILSNLTPKTYPTIFFLTPESNIIHEVFGYQPGDGLAYLAEEVKESYKKGIERLPARINWFHNLEEAQSYSLITKKNIYEYFYANSCGDCDRMEGSFSTPKIIQKLSEDYVCLKLNINTKYGGEQFKENRAWTYPFSFILNENGKELFSKDGYMDAQQLIKWLNIQDRLVLLSTMGFEKHKAFISQNTLAKNFLRYMRLQSAINILNEQKESVPEYGDIKLDLATAYRKLKQGELALKAYEEALEIDAPLTEMIAKEIVYSFIETNKLEASTSWLDNQIKKSKSPANKAFLSIAKSYAYEYLNNPDHAIEAAKQSVQIEKNNQECRLQVIKLSILQENYADAQSAIDSFEKELGSTALLNDYKGMLAERKGNMKVASDYRKLAAQQSGNLSMQIVNQELFMWTTNYYNYPGVIRALNQDCEEAIKGDETNILCHYILAQNYFIERNLEGAYSHISKALENSPEPPLKFTKGLVLIEQQKMEQATSIINEAEKQWPEEFLQPSDLVTLAMNNLYLKKNDLAIEQLKKAVANRNSYGIQDYYQKMAKDLLAQQKTK